MRELLFICWLWFGLSIIFGNESTEQETDNQTESVELVQELEIGHGLEVERKADLKIGLLDEGETYTAYFTEEGHGLAVDLRVAELSDNSTGVVDSGEIESINYKGCSIVGCVSSESNKEVVPTIDPIYDFFEYIFLSPLPELEEHQEVPNVNKLFIGLFSSIAQVFLYVVAFIWFINIVTALFSYIEEKIKEEETEEDPYYNYYSIDRFLYLEFKAKSEDEELFISRLKEFISKHKAKLLINGAIEHNNELLVDPNDIEAITSYIQDYLDSLLIVENYLVTKYQMTPIAAEEFVELNEHELLQNGAIEVLGKVVVKNKKKLNQFMKPEIKGMIKTSRVVTI